MKKLLLVIVLLWTVMRMGVETSFASENCIPARPTPQRLVNNLSKEFSGFISAGEEEALEQKLVKFGKETSNQIAIVIVDDMCGFEAPDFSFRLFDKWGIGQDKIDNGILIIIKPTGGEGKRDVGIVVGRGLEGAIPDAVAGKIKRNELIHNFQQGENYRGLDAATDVLMSLAKGEFNSSDYENENSPGEFSWAIIIFFIIVVVIISVARSRRGGGTTIGSGRTYYGGGWTSWGGGSGWSGGGGGGGFGGFGGGSTGGGGSFGKW